MHTTKAIKADETMTVLVQEGEVANIVPRASSVRVLRKPAIRVAKSDRRIFVISSTESLPAARAFVQEASNRRHLKALFVRSTMSPFLTSQVISENNMGSQGILKRTLFFTSVEDVMPRRVMFAWKNGVQDKMIARAEVAGDMLYVTGCDLETVKAPFSSIPALARIPKDERSNFIISDTGSYIFWEKADVHLDMDALKCAVNPTLKAKCRRDKLAHDTKFGAAVRTLREKAGLTQDAIKGLSGRQVRRIEAGAFPSISALERLSNAHSMNLDDYLDRIAELMNK